MALSDLSDRLVGQGTLKRSRGPPPLCGRGGSHAAQVRQRPARPRSTPAPQGTDNEGENAEMKNKPELAPTETRIIRDEKLPINRRTVRDFRFRDVFVVPSRSTR
jgi:hypothetical protein